MLGRAGRAGGKRGTGDAGVGRRWSWPAKEKEERAEVEEEKGKLGWANAETKVVRAGLVSGLGWIAKGFVFPFSISCFLSSFLFQTHSKLFEFKPYALNQLKICISMNAQTC